MLIPVQNLLHGFSYYSKPIFRIGGVILNMKKWMKKCQISKGQSLQLTQTLVSQCKIFITKV